MTQKRNILCLPVTALCLLLFWEGALQAQYLEVRTALDTNQIRIGEVFHLDIEVTQPPQIIVDIPVPQNDTLIDKIEILAVEPPDSLLEGEVLKIRQRLKLTSFDSGFYAIPPFEFHFQSATWNDSINSNPLYLMVHSVALDSTIYDIKAPIHVPVGFREVFPFVLGGLLVLALVGGVIWYIRRRKTGSPVFGPPPPAEPAHVIALRELDRLKEAKLWQQNEYKTYYTRLTEIIRQYIERRYAIPAMEMTSHETMEAWKQTGGSETGLGNGLNRLLNLADLVKFAKEKPLATENETHLETAYHFVRTTKIEPIPGASAGEESSDAMEAIPVQAQTAENDSLRNGKEAFHDG